MQTTNVAKKLLIAASLSMTFGGAAAPVLADDLTDKLCERGVLSEEDCNELNDSTQLVGDSKGKFEWKSRDGNSSIQIRGRVQLDYYTYDHEGDAEGFDIRRVYFGAQGKLYKDWSYAAVYNFDSNDLEYGYLDYKWSNAARLRVGAFKYQFSFEEITSSRFTDFMERSFVNRRVPAKDVGVMFYGQPTKNVFSYALGVAQGCGKNCNANDDGPAADDLDVIGRVAANLAPMANFDNGVLHIGAGYAVGDQPTDDPRSQGTEGRGLTFFDGSGPASGDTMERTRTNLEGVVIFGPVKVQGEWVTENLSGDGGFDRDIDAAYLSANWLLTGEQYVKNYSINGMKNIKPIAPIGSGGRGAWEIGVRFSQFDADDQYAVSAASTNKADAYTVGVKWIANDNLRFLLNYVKTDFDTPITAGPGELVDSETAINLRSQIHF